MLSIQQSQDDQSTIQSTIQSTTQSILESLIPKNDNINTQTLGNAIYPGSSLGIYEKSGFVPELVKLSNELGFVVNLVPQDWPRDTNYISKSGHLFFLRSDLDTIDTEIIYNRYRLKHYDKIEVNYDIYKIKSQDNHENDEHNEYNLSDIEKMFKQIIVGKNRELIWCTHPGYHLDLFVNLNPNGGFMINSFKLSIDILKELKQEDITKSCNKILSLSI